MTDKANSTPRRRGRPRTGTLELRADGYWARLTVDVNGKAKRRWFALRTHDKRTANRKVERLLKRHAEGFTDPESLKAEVKRAETYAEAAERIRSKREAEGYRDVMNERIRDRLHIEPVIGHLAVTDIRPPHVRDVLETGLDKGLSFGSLAHLRACMSNVFGELYQAGTIPQNPAQGVTVPKAARKDRRERAVLTDEELAVYLAAPLRVMARYERYEIAVLQRQVMSIMSRTFGGVRAGDLHKLTWDALDTDGGRFEFGHVARSKTQRPERLAIPELLRPYVRRWWKEWGEPSTGHVFPVLTGDDVGAGKRQGTSHAKALRRDLQRAFEWAHANTTTGVPTPESPRWRELFSDAEPYTKPVDFHSWRRAFVQGLADAGVGAQEAAALAGHSTLEAHMRYLLNTTIKRGMPDAAMPKLAPLAFRPAAMDDLPSEGTDSEEGNRSDSLARPEGFEPPTFGSEVRGARETRVSTRGIESDEGSLNTPQPADSVHKGDENSGDRRAYEAPAIVDSETLSQATAEALYTSLGGAL